MPAHVLRFRLDQHSACLLHRQAVHLSAASATPGVAGRKRKASALVCAAGAAARARAAGAAAPIAWKAQLVKKLQKKNPDPDEKLMHGKVPQLADWVDVWAAVGTAHSMIGMRKYYKRP